MKPLLVQVSVGSKKEADRLALGLTKGNLAACVQVIPGLESHYTWKGKQCRDQEWLLSIKTGSKKWDLVQAFIQKNHSYECPEIVAFSPSKISRKYLKWWKESLKSG